MGCNFEPTPPQQTWRRLIISHFIWEEIFAEPTSTFPSISRALRNREIAIWGAMFSRRKVYTSFRDWFSLSTCVCWLILLWFISEQFAGDFHNIYFYLFLFFHMHPTHLSARLMQNPASSTPSSPSIRPTCANKNNQTKINHAIDTNTTH